MIECPVCGDRAVTRAMMAPSVENAAPGRQCRCRHRNLRRRFRKHYPLGPPDHRRHRLREARWPGGCPTMSGRCCSGCAMRSKTTATTWAGVSPRKPARCTAARATAAASMGRRPRPKLRRWQTRGSRFRGFPGCRGPTAGRRRGRKAPPRVDQGLALVPTFWPLPLLAPVALEVPLVLAFPLVSGVTFELLLPNRPLLSLLL